MGLLEEICGHTPTLTGWIAVVAIYAVGFMSGLFMGTRTTAQKTPARSPHLSTGTRSRLDR